MMKIKERLDKRKARNKELNKHYISSKDIKQTAKENHKIIRAMEERTIVEMFQKKNILLL